MARASNGNGNGDEDDDNARVSITVDPSLRRKIRLAAALANMTNGEWCAKILDNAATKATEDLVSKGIKL